MRTLIDGYNLMYAVGLLGKRFGPDGFRRTRQRFLGDLAALLGPVGAHQTTVVFDAAAAPDDSPDRARHLGMSIIFAVGGESADERIESLIARHTSPKGLTVVSSDRRIRLAATRRGARAVASEDFWASLRERRTERDRPAATRPTAEERARLHGLSPAESEAWMDVFGHVAQLPEARDALGHADFVPTAEEIARIAEEVEREGL